LIVWTAVSTALTLQFSHHRHRLMWRPIGDDASYFADALQRLNRCRVGGFWSLVKGLASDPPHAPLSTFLAVAAFATLGRHDWAPYAVNGLLVLSLLGAVLWLLRDASWPTKIVGVYLAMATRLPKMMVEEFRPDFGASLAIAVGVLFCLRRPMTGNRPRAFVGGLWFGLALLMKPATFPLTIAISVATLMGSLISDSLETESLPGGREDFQSGEATSRHLARVRHWTTAGFFLLGLLAPSIPYFLVGGRAIVGYFYKNTFGAEQEVWSQNLTWIGHLRYYFDGDGGAYALGRCWAYILAALAIAGAALIWKTAKAGRRARVIAIGIVLILAYAGPSVVKVKNVFLGSASEILLMFLAILALKWIATWLAALSDRVDISYAGNKLGGGWSLVWAGALCVAITPLSEPPMSRPKAAIARAADSNRLTADLFADIVANARGSATIFIPAPGQTVEPACFAYLAALENLPLQFSMMDYAKWNDAALLESQIRAADFVIVGDPGNAETRTNLPTIHGVTTYLQAIESNEHFQRIATSPVGDGRNYYVFQRQHIH
jgi:hypothetical protein